MILDPGLLCVFVPFVSLCFCQSSVPRMMMLATVK